MVSYSEGKKSWFNSRVALLHLGAGNKIKTIIDMLFEIFEKLYFYWEIVTQYT